MTKMKITENIYKIILQFKNVLLQSNNGSPISIWNLLIDKF